MNEIVFNAMINVINSHKELLTIALKQKAKFEGWLKFEVAYELIKAGMKNVEVESKVYMRRDRTDITFFFNDETYSVELKTCNTNWRHQGIKHSTRPITKNIDSVINDAKKLNSVNGIVGFVLFPIPMNDNRWGAYIDRIIEKTSIEICKINNCRVIEFDLDGVNRSNVLVCTFMSRRFNNWF